MLRLYRFSCCNILLLVVATVAWADDRRSPVLEDFFRFELVENTSLSPDGELVAYTMNRRLGEGRDSANQYEFSMGDVQPRRDVWLVSASGGKPQNLTKGAEDGSSFWGAVWSPNSDSLMMLSTRGGYVRIWTWNKSTGVLKPLSDRRVSADEGLTSPYSEREWVSDHEILAIVPVQDPYRVPGGSRPVESVDDEVRSHASASVLQSGTEESFVNPDALLMKIDTNSGKEQLVAETSGFPPRGFWQVAYVSPNRRYVAYLRAIGTRPLDPGRPLSADNSVLPQSNKLFEVQVADLSRPGRSETLRGSSGLTLALERTSVIWSPDSNYLALRLYKTTSAYSPQTVSRCSLGSLSCKVVAAGARLQASSSRDLLWYGDHELLLHGIFEDRLEGRNNVGHGQPSWWKVDEDDTVHAFGREEKDLPETLYAVQGSPGLVGIVNGAIWTVDEKGVQTRKLFVEQGKPVSTIYRPCKYPTTEIFDRERLWSMYVEHSFVFRTGEGEASEFFEMDLRSGQIGQVRKPSSSAIIVAYEPNSKRTLFLDGFYDQEYSSASNNPTTLSSLRVGQDSVSTLLETNLFLQSIRPFRIQGIAYHTMDGQTAGASLTFPPDYKPGTRYPLIVMVYPGVKQRAQASESTEFLAPASEGEMQILAAHGYVVLQPSMPDYVTTPGDLRFSQIPKDPYRNLLNGVLPAIDKTVELGIADPERVGIIGHSFGGYATFGLITQTNRFKAAVAESGFSDLISSWGALNGAGRYRPETRNANSQYVEEVLGRGGPPWKDPYGYLGNSPLTYADRVTTPVMIVDGDMDPIEQSEEFFTAMERQGKRAEFVRYWGEDHVITSPQNLYDLWTRIYAWFDEFLKPLNPNNSSEK